MVIITADDYGKSTIATDRILESFSKKRITSVSAMVFMGDSERAASLALSNDMEAGLHLNFTHPFDAVNLPTNLVEHQNKIASYLNRSCLSQIVYNPFLVNSFYFVFRSQQDEFFRLYGKQPDHYNGHHHMHLCANLLFSRLIPGGARVRRTFTFDRSEKTILNRAYRQVLDWYVSSRFLTTDDFFSIAPVHNTERLKRILIRSNQENVEIETHPENMEETEFLLSRTFEDLFQSANFGNFRRLHKACRQFPETA